MDGSFVSTLDPELQAARDPVVQVFQGGENASYDGSLAKPHDRKRQASICSTIQSSGDATVDSSPDGIVDAEIPDGLEPIIVNTT